LTVGQIPAATAAGCPAAATAANINALGVGARTISGFFLVPNVTTSGTSQIVATQGTGLTQSSNPTISDGPQSMVFASGATGYVVFYLDLTNWNGGTISFQINGFTNASGGGTVFYNLIPGCLTFGATPVTSNPSYGSPQSTSTYTAPSFDARIFGMTIASVTHSCTAGAGHFLVLKMLRGAGSNTDPAQVLSYSFSGAF
jgi:hypothetical protein